MEARFPLAGRVMAAAWLVVVALGPAGCSDDGSGRAKAETLIPNPRVLVTAEDEFDDDRMSKLLDTVGDVDGVFQVTAQAGSRSLDVVLEDYDPDPQKVIDRIRKVGGVAAARYVPVEKFTVSLSETLRGPERALVIEQMAAVTGIVEVKDQGGIVEVRLARSEQDVPRIAADLADLYGVSRVGQ